MAKKRKQQATSTPQPRKPGARRPAAESEALARPDPDAPPVGAVPSRPSVYSEWLNTSISSEATVLAEAVEAERQAQAQRAPRRGTGNAAPRGGTPAPRQRRASQARRLADDDRLATGPQTRVEREQRQPRGGDRATDPHGTGFLPTMKIDRASGTFVLPTLSDDDLRAASPRRTNVPRPGQPRQTSGKHAALQRPSQGPARGGTAGPRASGVGLERGHVTDARLAITARGTAAQVSATGRATGAPVGRGIPVNSGVLIRGAHRAPKVSVAIVPRRLRPPSVVMHALVAVVTVAVLLGALMVSSPLGYGAAVRGTFQAYTNAVVLIPTPTPTATPTPVPPPPSSFSYIPASPGQQAIINEIQAVFGQYAPGALNVARCESGFNAGATNPYPVGNSHAEGVFQILYPSTWDTTSYAAQNPYNYDANIHAAWQIFSRDGYTWREWQCQP